jgi:hypothetical protein
MGYAKILSGGPTGRYSIELDYGSTNKTAGLAALNALLVRLDDDINELQVKIAEADAKEAAQLLRVKQAENDLILLAQSGLPAGSPELDTSAFNFELFKLRELQKNHASIRLRLEALETERALTVKRIAEWNAFQPIETRNAWCVNLTEDAEPGSYVGTVEIPGESNLILIAQGCRSWVPSDGGLFAREILSPAQAYFNAAILPGWQKFKPTYRWGTLTSVNKANDTGSVTLASSISSARSLNVNQTSTLVDIPIVYPPCNASPFVVSDEVVVEFLGQDWSNPRIIGFLDNPRPCNWACLGEGQIGPNGPIIAGILAFQSLVDELFVLLEDNTTLDVRTRINGGSWITMGWEESLGGRYVYRFPVDGDPVTNRFAQLWIRTAGGGPFVKAAFCTVDPPLTPDTRNIAEFAVYLSGNIVFNIAMTDRGNGVNAPAGSGAVKSPGGIDIVDPFFPVTLLDYTLISETT